MAIQNQNCFDDVQFNRFLENDTDPNEEARILAHIATCAQCQSTLEKLAGQEKVWNDIKLHLAEQELFPPGDETREHLELEDRQRDLKKVQDLLGPTDNPEMLGRLGGYEVCGMIGRGSAGVVVKALDTRLNRFVAIKLLAPVYSNNGSSRRRFEREGRAIASVKDPNVIPVHTVGDYQGTPYIVMQYVPDGSLHQRIEKLGPLSTSEVVCVGMQIAKGLAAAHKRGIVHRDVKPANVLLESGVDCAMVTDFGLARVVDEATMTRSGAISGTPQYMSPEQAKGETVDPRSDLFSLGSVMYAACTGHSPFRAESVFGVIKRVCESQPRPIRETNPEIPQWLTAFVAKLHSKRIDDRFASADQVAELLAHELAHLQSPTMVTKPARQWWEKPKRTRLANISLRTAAISTAILASALLVGVFAWSGLGGANDNGPVQPSTTTSSLNSGPGLPSPPPTAEYKSPASFLAFMIQENEKLQAFEQTVEETIDVKSGGQLFLRTNLGSLDIETHDQPTIQMKLIHSVKAKDKSTADKLFKALKMEYELQGDAIGDVKLSEDQDAAIVATFPTRKLTEKEIEESDDLVALKDQLLIRNNSHHTNAKFMIRIPENFNLNLESSAGRIKTTDIDGWAKFVSHGGSIEVGNITGRVNFETHGGSVTAGDLGADVTIESHGGRIEMGNVNGKLSAHSHGGSIHANNVADAVDAETHGGRIELGHTQQAAKVKAHGGSITIWKAERQVDADAAAGSIRVNFVGQPDGDSVLKSAAGSIRVGYVEDIAFDINASCSLGKISAPFAEKNSSKMQYQLNGGKHKLEATSKVGSVKFLIVNEEEITQELEESLTESQGQRAFQRAYDLHMEGKIDEAIIAHQTAAEFENHKGIATYNLGCAWSLKGETDKAFAALNDAVTFGFDDVQQFKHDGDLDSLRKEDRFTELMLRLERNPKKDDEDYDSDATDDEGESSEVDEEIQRLISRARGKASQDKFEEAEKLYRSVLVLDAENEYAILNLGFAIHSLGRLDEAYQWHQRAAKTQAHAGLGNYNMACVHSLRNEPDQAFDCLQKAIENDFHSFDHMKTDSDLDNIRSDERFKELMDKADKECCPAENEEI